MRSALPLLSILLASACATPGESPSLAPRPIEQRFQAPDAPPPPPTAPIPADAPLAARIAALLSQLRAADTAFAAALPEAERAAGAAGTNGSEGWIVAQQRLTILESARGPATIALGELDSLLLARLNAAGEAQGGIIELEAAQAEASRIVGAQNARLSALRSRLSG